MRRSDGPAYNVARLHLADSGETHANQRPTCNHSGGFQWVCLGEGQKRRRRRQRRGRHDGYERPRRTKRPATKGRSHRGTRAKSPSSQGRRQEQGQGAQATEHEEAVVKRRPRDKVGVACNIRTALAKPVEAEPGADDDITNSGHELHVHSRCPLRREPAVHPRGCAFRDHGKAAAVRRQRTLPHKRSAPRN